MVNIEEIITYFPKRIQNELKNTIKKDINQNSNIMLEEIRCRANKPVILKYSNYEYILENCYISQEEILETIQSICQNSIYSYQNEICNGFITIKGGHRVGISGSAVVVDGKVTNINYISCINFRIAKQINNASNSILKYVLNMQENTVYNTLIISPPGGGKTTILRDLVQKISNGMEDINFKGIDVGLVDERGEIAATYKGIPQNNIGIRTDVLDNIPKYIGMNMMIRSMAPKVIVADEIGNIEDVKAINYAVCCGIKGIFTMHGRKFEDLKLNPYINQLVNINIFERLIFLDENKKGQIKEVYILNDEGKYISSKIG
jgi:stage III sporulation protein AA